ncbi:MAG TPA: tyrosine-type recombinase/integrase [Pyrinomonadaceae bacterium]|nr:tyrosine-type recombinase/integrase [Pyrinomonadaceae bacterium]
MAGQIIKRGDRTWLVRIFLGRDAKGKQLFHRKTIHGTKKDAETYRNKVVRDRDMGTFIEPAAMAVKDYLDKWLKTAARPRLRERTYDDYSELLKRYVRADLGEKRLCDVRPLDIQNLYADMTGRGLSARTVRYTHAILSSAFKQAIRWQMLIHNPCEAIELPRAERREMSAFSPNEAEEFLKAAKENEHGVIFAFALATGMRPEEYLGLKWSDLDMEKDTAIVRRVLVRRKGGGWYFGEPKTSRSRRTVPLPTTLVKMLTDHRRKQIEKRLKAGAAYQNNDLVFATVEGTPHNSRNLAQRQFQSILKSAKLPLNFRLYDLRHSCATLLLVAGENPKVVSERLGHASVVLTLDTYSHVLPSMQREATEKLEKMLFSR